MAEFPYPNTQVEPASSSDSSQNSHPVQDADDEIDSASNTLMELPHASDIPDLYDYFLMFDFSTEEIIRYCRAYASTLAASIPQKRRKKRRKPAPPMLFDQI